MSKKQATTDPFSIRLPKALHKRVSEVIAATDNEYNRSQIVVRALEMYFALLSLSPSLLPEYDPEKDKSVTHSSDL